MVKHLAKVCSSNNVAPSTLSDWKKAVLLDGFGNKEVKRLQKLQEETEEKLAAAKTIWSKRVRDRLIKKRAV